MGTINGHTCKHPVVSPIVAEW